MKCLSCDSEALVAKIAVERLVPLAARNGAVKIGGVKISQFDLKDAWENQVPGGTEERLLRGPILCTECGTEHYYVVRSKVPLRIGSYAEAALRGYEVVFTEA